MPQSKGRCEARRRHRGLLVHQHDLQVLRVVEFERHDRTWRS